ncbi:hypothetical protein ACWC09_26470 [Streptomyces sp. NPDC001617]
MTDQTTRQTVEYFLQSREEGGTWEDSSAFSDDYAWAAERLAKRQNLVPGFEYRIAQRVTTIVVGPADAAESTADPEPRERGELWSLLDWTFWGSGMGDVFREPLADTMLAAITPEQLETAQRLMQAWHDSGRQPLGRRRYEELTTQLKEAQEQAAELERIRAAVTEGKYSGLGRPLTASDAQVAHEVTRKELAGALDAGLHLNWKQLVEAAQRSHDANAAWAADVDRVRTLHSRGKTTGCCNDCGMVWPCTTIQALDESRLPRQTPALENKEPTT